MPTEKTTKASAKKHPSSAKTVDRDIKLLKGDIEEIKEVLSEARDALQAAGFRQFVRYLGSPWRIMFHNLLAGIFRGLGILLGMTLVFALMIWFLYQMIDFPLIGQYLNEYLYIQEILDLLEKFSLQNGSSFRQLGGGA